VNNIKTNITDNKIHDYLNPEYLYIPILDGYKVMVKEDSNVLKEEAILSNGELEIYSPISGKVIGKTSSLLLNNNKINSLVIENNYKEDVKKQTGVIRYISDYSKKDMIDLIHKYQASNVNLKRKAKRIIVNGIDKDPYEKTRSYLIDNYSDKILETVDSLGEVLGIEEIIFAINNNDSNNVINLSSHIGTYPNIKLKLMPDVYPIGFKSILLKNILNRKQMEEGVIVLNVEDVHNIYTVLKRRKPILDTLITISGNAVETPMVVRCKIGTSMQDLIKNTCKISNDNYYVVINGLISGITLENLNSVITKDIRSIFLNTISEDKEVECINCGLCNIKCPLHLNPKYIKEHKRADKSKCIGCGLCTYICPSKINFKPYVGGKNEE
jgi:electron transport complex protein RnfC